MSISMGGRSRTKRATTPPGAATPVSRRREIQSVAASMFVLRGFEGTTMREIAKAAGILPGSLYHHFTSKEELLHEIMKPFLRRTLDHYREIIRRRDRPGVMLRDLVEAALSTSLTEPATHSILLHQWGSFARNPRFAYVVKSWREVRRLWSDVIEAGVKAGEFRMELDVDLTTDLVLEQISSTVFWSQFKPETSDTIAAIIRAHIELLMHGMLTTSTSRNRNVLG